MRPAAAGCCLWPIGGEPGRGSSLHLAWQLQAGLTSWRMPHEAVVCRLELKNMRMVAGPPGDTEFVVAAAAWIFPPAAGLGAALLLPCALCLPCSHSKCGVKRCRPLPCPVPPQVKADAQFAGVLQVRCTVPVCRRFGWFAPLLWQRLDVPTGALLAASVHLYTRVAAC